MTSEARTGVGALVLSCMVALVLLAVGSPAAAQTDSSAEVAASAEEANGRRLFGAGSAAYEERRYEDALGYFEQAYALTQRPVLLYNIGLAAEHGGHRDRAIAAFEQYLADAPDAENAVEVQGRLAVLRRAGSADTADETDATPVAAPPPAAPPPSPSSPGPEGWIVMGTGIALVAAGGVLLGIGANDYATVTGLPDGGSWASVRDAADRAPLLVGIGAACAAVGLVGTIVGIVVATSGSGGEATVTARVGLDGFRVEGTF